MQKLHVPDAKFNITFDVGCSCCSQSEAAAFIWGDAFTIPDTVAADQLHETQNHILTPFGRCTS